MSTDRDDPPRPLADRMRPQRPDDVAGQEHLLSDDGPLARALAGRTLHSMILWGPPGTGKTTLARLLAHSHDAQFMGLSAVMCGVKDIREAVARAQAQRTQFGQRSVLFLDEVHRFNKAQQDAFLPYVEDGTLIFVGATTENPSFALNNALLSRARVYVLKPLTVEAIARILRRALADEGDGVATRRMGVSDEQIGQLARAADGDARRALNFLELLADLTPAGGDASDASVAQIVAGGRRRFDHHGDEFYDQISALHKSVRGSNPDAALYWLARMLDGGCDPRYVTRRLVRMASEDIGNADPRALAMALDAAQAYERLGSPEGELAIHQAVAFLACAAKSDAVYKASKAALEDVRRGGSLGVPAHLRNAPTRLMKELGHGAGYRHAHLEDDAYAAGETYFPEEMGSRRYYHPVPRGLEIRIGERLAELRRRDDEARAGGGDGPDGRRRKR